MPATVIRCGPRASLPRTAAARATPRASPPPRSCLPACVASWRGSSASSPLAIKATPPADAILLFLSHPTPVSFFASKIRRVHSPFEPPKHLHRFARNSATPRTLTSSSNHSELQPEPFSSDSGRNRHREHFLWPALLRPSLPLLSSSLKSRWATGTCAPLGLCSIHL